MIEYIKFFSEIISKAGDKSTKKKLILDLVLHEAKFNMDLLKLARTKTVTKNLDEKTKLLRKLDTSSMEIILVSGISLESLFGGKEGKESDFEEMDNSKNPKYYYIKKNCSELYEFCIRKSRMLKAIAETETEKKCDIRVSVRMKNVSFGLEALIQKVSV
jgi:hypothetical protein